MKLRFVSYFILGLLLGQTSFAFDQKLCFANLSQALRAQDALLSDAYQKEDQSPIRPLNQSRLQLGGAKVAILVHGLAGSPYEMHALADHYHDLGFTTIEPLVQGFGASVRIVNSSSSDEWASTLTQTIENAMPCASEINLVGFSLGGAVVTDFILNHVGQDQVYHDDKGASVKISSVILASPLFALRENAPIQFFNFLLSKRSSVDVKMLYHFTRLPDLKALVRHPQFYNSRFPLVAARHSVIYAGSIRNSSAPVSQVPAMLAYSEYDGTIDLSAAVDVVQKKFRDQREYVFAKDLKIPHQILLRDFDPTLDRFFEAVDQFLKAAGVI